MPSPPTNLAPRTHNEWVVPRPRVTRRIVDLVDRFGVVWVLGSAGSGKTTAVADAVASLDRPEAWVTFDATESAPGRLLLRLERALTAALPGLPPVATEALAAKAPHVEAAAYLAGAVADHPVVVVLDEVEKLADAEPARMVLSAFVRALAPTARIVLISRRDMALHLGGARAVGGVGYVAERDLAFTVTEAARVLAGLDRVDSVPETVVEATGGWVAGVLFEAWRSPDHPHGAGGEVDALSGYLSSEIMHQLTDEQQWFLVATSLLRVVDASAAARLGLHDARELIAGLRTHHMPVSFSEDGTRLRCHPRFREFLRRRLDDHGGPEVRALHVAHGHLLLRDGQAADAVDAYLEGADVAAATAAAQVAIPEVLRRGDVAVADRWLRALRRDAVDASEVLTRARLEVALERESWVVGAATADHLLQMLRADEDRAPLEAGLAGLIGTCYLHVGRFDDAVAVIDGARPGPARDTWRWALALDCTDQPAHYRDRPADRGETVDGLLHRLDYMHGRFGKLLQAQPAPWAAARSSRVAALCAVGRFPEALALLDESPSCERSPAMIRIYVGLLVDLGRTDEARTAIERGREVALRSSPYCALLHGLLEAEFALRVDRDVAAATRVLDRVEEDPTAGRRTRVVDQVALWRGLAALIVEDDEEAAVHLRRAVDTMRRCDRQLLMPAAAVYLAEAEWRLGDEAAADAAADQALAAAGVHGSDHLLLRALHEYPAVVSRRIDAERGSDSPWHALGRALLDDRAPSSVVSAAATHVQEFGPAAIVHGGRRVDPRLSRSFELLAHLAAHGGTSAKTQLLADLFGGETDDKTRSYLRQALKRLRDALPSASLLDYEGSDVRWTGGALTSDSMLFEAAVARATRLRGRDRLDADLDALAASERGEYFPGSTSTWIQERRDDLRRTMIDLRLNAAELAFEIGELERAQAQADLVLREDPYRESAWRLAMRIASAMGFDDRVIYLYRRCQERLTDLPTVPAPSTQRLLEQLRR
jgi:ATP/maltotriose-dependent transcriptional regulator MalT/DNA-binding SARP family transcriptional activator